MAAMPVYGKSLKNLNQNEESFEAESWYIALGTQGLPSFFSNNDPRFDLFMARSNLHSYAFVWGKY